MCVFVAEKIYWLFSPLERLKLIYYDLSSTAHTETLMRAAVSGSVLDLLCGFEVLKAFNAMFYRVEKSTSLTGGLDYHCKTQ